MKINNRIKLVTLTIVIFSCITNSALTVDIKSIGEVQIQATAATDFDSNIFFNENEIDDIIIRFRPTATYIKRFGPLIVAATGGGDFARYIENGDEDFSNPISNINIGMAEDFGLFSLDKRSAGKISFGFDTDISQRTESNEQLQDLVSYTLYAANFDVRYNHSPKFGASINYAYNFSDYQNLSSISKIFTDIESQTIGADLYYIYSPKLDFFLAYDHTMYDGRSGNSFYVNNDVSRVRFGAEGTFTPKIKGQASVGYAFRSFDNAFVNSEDGFIFDASVQWQFRQKTGLSIGLGRQYVPTAQDNASISSNYNISLIQKFTKTMTGTIGYNYRVSDYQSYLIDPYTVPEDFFEQNLQEREDTSNGFNIVLDNAFTPHLRGRAIYTYTKLNSGYGDIFSNERHLLSFSATLSY